MQTMLMASDWILVLTKKLRSRNGSPIPSLTRHCTTQPISTVVRLLTIYSLLSKLGIPKLRVDAKDGISKKLRLKGKGHEFSDAAKLLNYFQLWLDDLYPRAKFADGLQMVEKVGHSKTMQVMRREWINESRRKELYGDDDMYGGQTGGAVAAPAQNTGGAKEEGERPITVNGDGHDYELFFPDAGKKPEARNDDEPDDDELEALLAEQATMTRPNPQRNTMADDSEGEDDLDALFAEAERPNAAKKPREDGAADEGDLDVLSAEQEHLKPLSATEKRRLLVDEDDELDALMAEYGIP